MKQAVISPPHSHIVGLMWHIKGGQYFTKQIGNPVLFFPHMNKLVYSHKTKGPLFWKDTTVICSERDENQYQCQFRLLTIEAAMSLA